MSNTELAQYSISPEIFEVATSYVKTLNSNEVSKETGIPHDQVVSILEKPDVKRYIDHIFLEQGYMQRNKLNDVMGTLIDQKIEELAETGLGSNKDILELLKFAHSMRMDNVKLTQEDNPSSVTNVQNNFGGDNYSKLMERIVGSNL